MKKVEIVRITVDRGRQSVPFIREGLIKLALFPYLVIFITSVIKLLKDSPDCAKPLDKYRINPRNVGFKNKKISVF
ncbi:MAG: hypothetical protein CM15mP73_1590 [Hyphomicrobiales bacterium]|nr:MAG: hypothetical protein CM15mP73_1590 [Hyphomicrobiales bacterium]